MLCQGEEGLASGCKTSLAVEHVSVSFFNNILSITPAAQPFILSLPRLNRHGPAARELSPRPLRTLQISRGLLKLYFLTITCMLCNSSFHRRTGAMDLGYIAASQSRLKQKQPSLAIGIPENHKEPQKPKTVRCSLHSFCCRFAIISVVIRPASKPLLLHHQLHKLIVWE